ncbi:unnamed protein product [Effrenium voratum]|nr:unnamed protein product [Effrenium voratum]
MKRDNEHVGTRTVSAQPEVVRRERPAEVTISLSWAAALEPDARSKWLSQALQSIASGRARASDIFDVVTHARFAAGVSCAVATRMMQDLQRHVGLFPQKLGQALAADSFPLAAAAKGPAKTAPKVNPEVEAMLARCIDFVRRNESAIQAVHNLESRTFQVQLQRERETLWGITWAREAFQQRRRVVQQLVPGSPAARWNEQNGWTLQAGDELVAVNGLRSWEDMSSFKDLLEARLTFVRARPEELTKEPEGPRQTLRPPKFGEDYLLDASGSGWWGHMSGAWLFNKAEGIYFHTVTGKLIMEDSQTGDFIALGSAGAPDLAPPARLKGCIRWFSKGFGFIAPWPELRDSASSDVFLHRSELLPPEGEPAALPVIPGMPVDFDLSMKDGKPSATCVRQLLDLHALCRVGFSIGSCSRFVSAPIELKAEGGQRLVACSAGLVLGRRGMGGAEFVASNLTKDLQCSFRGRELGGVRGAKAAMLAGFQRTQQGFLQYAQHLSENSARLWLAAETSASMALIFGPDKDAQPSLLLGDVGSAAQGLVVRKDGSVSSRICWPGASRDEEKEAKDSLKVFEHGLKGPSISFPAFRPTTEPKGFGAHASEKDGLAAGLSPRIEQCQLDWQQDAWLLLGSPSLWACLDENKTAQLATTATSPEQLAEDMLKAPTRRAGFQDFAAAAVRFPWVALGPQVASEARTSRTEGRLKRRKLQEVDDIFAPREQESEASESEA